MACQQRCVILGRGLAWPERKKRSAASQNRRRKIEAGAGGPAGQVTEELARKMEEKLRGFCEHAHVLRDAEARTVSIEAISDEFEGKAEIDRQRAVLKALQDELEEVVFAVDHVDARTPNEVSSPSE